MLLLGLWRTEPEGPVEHHAEEPQEVGIVQKQKFNPKLDVIQPTSSSRKDHIGTVRIEWQGRVIHVLFHEGGSARFRLNQTNIAITEAFLKGKSPDGHAIIQVTPV
jgi:hypothetical protein